MSLRAQFISSSLFWLGTLSPLPGLAQTGATAPNQQAARAVPAARSDRDTPANVLTDDEWRRTDAAVERALKWLAEQQNADGSFPTIETGQPGVTSLCVMAFLAHGHVPGDGQYGERLERAADFILSRQKQNGLLSVAGPDGPRITRNVEHEIGVCCAYNHAISSLLVSELYGMSAGERAKRMEAVTGKSLAATLEMQRWPKDHPEDRGGWRYLNRAADGWDSDLSITGWNLMFLRSARNAGFDVRKEPIEQAVRYIQRCYSQRYGAFQYLAADDDHRSRAMAGAGILAMAHAGFHRSPEAQKTGDWILQHGFDQYNVAVPFTSAWPHDRYHYAVLNCCQGMYQLGGRYWEVFFPRVVNTLLTNQQADGSWPADNHWHDSTFGNAYTTALVVISLGAPNQLLPIFQR
jgi:hypothetical protein